jgi:hypothetical protein
MNREERIKARAHAIWEEEGHPESRSDDHWERAEREIDSEAAQEGGNEETGAALASHAEAEAQASDEGSASSGSNEALLQEGSEGSAQLHEDVTGSPQPKPLGKKSGKGAS